MKNKLKLIALALPVIAMLLASCSGSGNSAPSDKSKGYNLENLSLGSVSSSGATFKSGHTATVSVAITSVETETVTDVPVTIFFVEDVSDSDSPEQYYSGTYNIDELTPGTADYTLTINVPQMDGSATKFQVVAMFYEKFMDKYSPEVKTDDAGNDTTEVEIDDDDSDGSISSGTVDIDNETQDVPDLTISSMSMDEDIVTLYSNYLAFEGKDSTVPLSMTLNIENLSNVPASSTVKFTISHLDGSMSYDLKVKDASSSGDAADELSVAEIAAYTSNQCSVELVVPTDAIAAFVEYAKSGTSVRYPFVINAELTCAEETSDFTSNNSSQANFWIIPDDTLVPDTVDGREIGFSYSKFYGNSNIGAGFKMSCCLGIDRDKIYSDNSSSVPLSVFGKSLKLFTADMYIRGYFEGKSTDGKSPGIHISIKYLKPKLSNFANMATLWSYDNDAYYAYTYGGVDDGKNLIAALSYSDDEIAPWASLNPWPNGNDPSALNAPSEGYWEASYTYEKTFMAGPIPITVKAALTGYAGVGLFAVYQQVNVAAGAIPYAGLTFTAEASVGLPVVGFGVGGELDIINLQLRSYVWTDWEDATAVVNNVSVNCKSFSINEYTGLNINLIRGALYAFVNYPWPKFKKKWGVKIFVGFETKQARYYIWQQDGWALSKMFTLIPHRSYGILIPLN